MVAERIAQYIKDHDILQSKVAQKAGLSKQAMSDSMRGVRKLGADEYVSICAVLGVDPNYFAQCASDERKVVE